MTINPYGNFYVYEPQLVHKAPDDGFANDIYNQPIIATIKKDGSYYRLVKENNQVFLFSRTISKKTGFYAEKIDNVPHIKKWAEKYLPNGTCLIGEIYYPHKSSKDVTKVMGCLPEKAVKVQDDMGPIHFYIHDIIKYNGYDYVVNSIPYSKRYSDLCRYIDIETEWKPQQVYIAKCIDNTYCNLSRALEQNLCAGEEGMVFRLENGLYRPGKRDKNTWKVKEHIDSIDVVIMEILPPEKLYTGKDPGSWPFLESSLGVKKYRTDVTTDELAVPVTKDYFLGRAGGIRIGAYDDKGELQPIGRVASGLNDQLKQSMADNPQLYLNNVCSIGCMSVDKDAHTFRHPAFLQMRYDKDKEDCKISDIFA